MGLGCHQHRRLKACCLVSSPNPGRTAVTANTSRGEGWEEQEPGESTYFLSGAIAVRGGQLPVPPLSCSCISMTGIQQGTARNGGRALLSPQMKATSTNASLSLCHLLWWQSCPCYNLNEDVDIRLRFLTQGPLTPSISFPETRIVLSTPL